MLRGQTIELPPFVDMHVHCREPGSNPAETIASATEAAASGGVGVLNDMSNNAPQPTSTEEAMREKHQRARNTSVINFGTAAGAQPEYDNIGQLRRIVPWSLLVKLYGGPTTNINRSSDYEAREFDEVLTEISRVDPTKLVGFHSGNDNYRDFIGHAAGDRGLRVQLHHVNKMDQVLAVEEAKARGWDVEASICPHTMLLTEHDRLTRSSYADMQPSLVHQDEAERLFRAFTEGRIKDLETDHAPHTHEAKQAAIEANPACEASDHANRCCGVPNLDLAARVMFWQVEIGRLPLERLLEGYSTHPAERLGLKQGAGSKVVWDMKPFRIENEPRQVVSAAGWTPYLGMMALGTVREMTLSGQVVYRAGRVVSRPGRVITGNGEVI